MDQNTLYEQARAMTPENTPIGAIAQRIMQNLGIPADIVSGDQPGYSASRLHILHYRGRHWEDAARMVREDAEAVREIGRRVTTGPS